MDILAEKVPYNCHLGSFVHRFVHVNETGTAGGVLYRVHVRGRAIGKGIDFTDIGIKKERNKEIFTILL